MKNRTLLLLLLLITICFKAKSDIILHRENAKASIFVSIQNMDKYPNVVLIGVYEGMALSKSNNNFKIKPGESYLIQEFAPLKIYAVSKAYLDKTSISTIDWETNVHVFKSNLEIDSKMFNEKAPIGHIEMDYKIAGFDDNGLVMYKMQQKYTYNNGKKDLILKFDFKDDLTKLRQNIE